MVVTQSTNGTCATRAAKSSGAWLATAPMSSPPAEAPTYTVSGRDGATATAPMPVRRTESLTQFHTWPPSTVFQTPLPAVPKVL